MNILAPETYERIWKTHTDFIGKHARWIALIYLIATCIALWYTSQNLGVNSRTGEMFNPNLEFRQLQEYFNEQFPLTQDNFLVVVESDIPEQADSVTSALADRFSNEPDIFKEIFYPGGDPFFKKNRLLFLDREELKDVTDKLSRSYVFLSFLSQNYSLRGLLLLLDRVVSMGNEEQINALKGLFGQIDSSITARINGTRKVLSWQKAMGRKSQDDIHRQIIQVKANLDFDRLIASKTAIDRAHELVAPFSNNRTTIGITGEMAMSYEELTSVTRGAVFGSLLALLLVSLILWIGLRSFRLILSSLLTLVAGLALTMSFSAAAVGQLNLISIAFTILYIGLGVDYAIHFTLKFNELRHSGFSIKRSLGESFMDLNPALMLSALSTMFGFYAFLPTEFKGVSELGLIAGTGMIISFVVTFTLLPALLTLFYSEKSRLPNIPVSAPLAQTLTTIQIRHTSKIRVTAIIAGIFSLVLLTRIRFDYNPINLRDPDTESVNVMKQLLESDEFTPWTAEVLATDSSETLEIARALEEKPLVSQVQTIYSFIPNHQQDKLGRIRRLKSRIEQLPPPQKDTLSLIMENQIDAIRQLSGSIHSSKKQLQENIRSLQMSLERLITYLKGLNPEQQKQFINSLESDLLRTFPEMVENLKFAVLAEQVNLSDIPEGLKHRWLNREGTFRIQAEPIAGLSENNELRNFANQVREVANNATGSLITIIESGDIVVQSFIKALTYALIVIAITIFIYLRNLRYTMYILLPLLLAAGMTTATMVLAGLHFNFANIITLPLILGLGVDNGIHIVHRYRNNGADSNLLGTTTARAVFFSSLTTLFSFGNLAFSPHRGTASMGIILTFGLLFVLFTTLFVLPAFLISKTGKREQAES